MKKNAKTEKVIDVGLTLLKTQGDFGLSMRKVATDAEMSLSNVQYYFKTKDDLLKAMADRYFEQCLEELKSVEALQDHARVQDELSVLLGMFLSHGVNISDMCRIFREYWAIATRNEAIERYVLDYYQEMANILTSKLLPVAKDDKSAKEAVSILIPYIEGYTVSAAAMPEDVQRITELLTTISMRILKAEMN